jgi:hypothetical protein
MSNLEAAFRLIAVALVLHCNIKDLKIQVERYWTDSFFWLVSKIRETIGCHIVQCTNL